MPEQHTSEAEYLSENAAFSKENAPEPTDPAPIVRETTKQFPLRLPISVIEDLENEVKTRRLRGEMIETPMYCRYVLEHHRKVADYDTEIEALREENAVLSQRILEMKIHSETTAQPQEQPESAKETARAFKALQIAVQKAAETMAESGCFTTEYYETLVSEYFRQILPQIPQ